MQNLKIGADIELGLKENNYCITVPRYLKTRQNRIQVIGSDHNGNALEIRPKESTSPRGLFVNIKNLLMTLYTKANGKNIRVISSPYFAGKIKNPYMDYREGVPLGGHIHLSWIGEPQLTYYRGYQIYQTDPSKYFEPDLSLSALHVLGTIIEDRDLSICRYNAGYGASDDMRIASNRHIELRRLPSFLYNPLTTLGVLSFVYSIFLYELQHRGNSSVYSLIRKLNNLADRADHYHTPSTQKTGLRLIKELAEMLPFFNNHKEERLALKYLLNRKLPLPSNRDILKTWGLTK